MVGTGSANPGARSDVIEKSVDCRKVTEIVFRCLGCEQAAEVVKGKVGNARGSANGLCEATPRIHRRSIASKRDQESLGRGVGGFGEKALNNGARFAHEGKAMLLGVLRATGGDHEFQPVAIRDDVPPPRVGEFLSAKREQQGEPEIVPARER
jgi:hypothetical protein